VYRRLKIELWKNRSPYPRELLPWDEGSTQVDVTISWENPPTTVFLEFKYGSDLSAKTTNGHHNFPSDQLIRNARVGLWECGWFSKGRLFPSRPRDFVLILVQPNVGHPLVEKYRRPETLLKAIPHHDRLCGLPATPFVGEIGYGQLATILKNNRRWWSRPERMLAENLCEYLQYKRRRIGLVRRDQQLDLGWEESGVLSSLTTLPQVPHVLD
jgi:hypothetical protein